MLWDVPTTSLISLCREHDPYPCTSVDFCPTEADIFATSSEDCTVRIWHLSQQKSTAQITVPSAVHSVRWNPVLESQVCFFFFVCLFVCLFWYFVSNFFFLFLFFFFLLNSWLLFALTKSSPTTSE